MKMTSRERILAVINGEKPDRLPWAPLIGQYYVNSLKELGIDLEDIAPKSVAKTDAIKRWVNLYEIEVPKYLGADIIYRHVMVYKIKYNKCEEFEEMDGDIRRVGYVTPLGRIYSEMKTGGGTEFITKYLVKSLDDIKIYSYLIDNTEIEVNYQDYKEFDEYIGDDGIATLTGPVTPLQELLQFKMGVEYTAYNIGDYPEEMEELMDKMHELNKKIYVALANCDALVTITYEDTSTTVLSKRWYKKYCINQLNDYTDILHGEGKIHIVHMCGKISKLTDMIAEGRMDGIDSVCPPSTGDLEPGDALQQLSGKIIIGGLEPPALVRMSTEDAVKYAAEKIHQVGNRSNFILSTGDSTAACTPVENLKAISSLIADNKN
jgi:uroporphyrinogen-III decarboxylase